MRMPLLVVLTILTLAFAPMIPANAEDAPAVAPAPTAAPVGVTPVTPAVPAAAPQPATVTPDTNVFKRTPSIDGTIANGEWDVFYTSSQAIGM